jgi:tetratricopeptide (TPR) repeat protein
MNRKEIILQEIDVNPENPLNHYLLAVEERAEGNFEACILVLKTLISNYPDYHPSYYTLAELLYQLDHTLEATRIANLGIAKAKDLQFMKVLHELEQLVMLND